MGPTQLRPATRVIALAVGLILALGFLLPAAARAATTLTVTTTADSNDGKCTPALCSFRDALSYAETGDTIVLGAATYKGAMLGGNGVWSPSGEYTVQGAGAGKTTIDGSGLSRTFALYGHVTMIGVTVTGGKGPNAGCTCGGAFEVRQGGFLTLIDSVVEGNSAPDGGGGIDVDSQSNAVLQNVLVSQNTTTGGGGGGIRVEPNKGEGGGTLKMTGVTISGNSTTGSSGAGLDNQGETSATDVTITGNASSGEGGGVLNENAGSLALNATTIANDIVAEKAAGIDNLGTASRVTVRNTIVADGCSGTATPAVASQGHNLDVGNTCGFTALGDLTNKDPLLGPLANNGGPTELPTLALGAGSPAIDAGDNATCPTTDARGVPRPHGLVCDMGAFELSPPLVTTTAASGVTTSGASVGGNADPSGLDTSARIEYGTTTAYGSSTAAQDVGSGTSAVTVAATLSGLAPNTTYHYRVLATNRDGMSVGADATFVTGAAPGLAAPTITGATQSANVWRLGSALPRAAARHGHRPSVGTTFSYQLNEAATVQFAFTQTTHGRKVGSKCIAQTRANKRKRGCTRTRTVATLTVAGHTGTNTLRFQGRVSSSRKLGPGSYTVLITATNPAAQKSAPARLSFRLVKG
ncbi:MAG TPA: choice-of-anchor Q domain-containing protein [Solirubrobacteraceae bacterium]